MHQAKQERMRKSAENFWCLIRPLLEPRLKATIHPLELLQRNELVDAFDQVGIDAFTVNRKGYLQGLASRMQSTHRAAKRPSFSFRYARWDYFIKEWDMYREYQRKLYAVKNPTQAILYPYYHVESCVQKETIQWSFIAKTEDLMRYIERYENDRTRTYVYEPKTGEKRQVIDVYIDAYQQECQNISRLM